MNILSVKLLVWEKSNLHFYLFTLIKLINLTNFSILQDTGINIWQVECIY